MLLLTFNFTLWMENPVYVLENFSLSVITNTAAQVRIPFSPSTLSRLCFQVLIL